MNVDLDETEIIQIVMWYRRIEEYNPGFLLDSDKKLLEKLIKTQIKGNND